MRIAFLRANGIGDFVVTLPGLEAIKNKYPTSELILLGRPWHREFLQSRPSPIDRVLVIPHVPVVYEPNEKEKSEVPEMHEFLAQIRDLQLDYAIQGHGGGRFSNPFVKKLGARITVGCRTPEAEPLDYNLPYDRDQHEIFRHLELVKMIGAPPVTIQPRLETCERDIKEASRVMDLNSPFVLIQSDAGDNRRCWPHERYLSVAEELKKRGWNIVFNSPALSLNALYGLIKHARLVISNDSGPMHLAVAAGTPCVGLFWHQNYMTYAPPMRANFWGLISWLEECKICGRLIRETQECLHEFSWVEPIKEKDVLNACLTLLKQKA